MSTNTTNYNLKKPALAENFNLADMNTNLDTIDAAIKTVDENIILKGFSNEMKMVVGMEGLL